MEIVIDATDKIVGRFASYAAKQALLGNKVIVINCEKAILSGTKKVVCQRWKDRINMGQPQQGPYVQRRPDRFIRRTIRGMLPYKQPKGKKAFERVMCYVGEHDKTDAAKVELPKASFEKLPNLKFITVGELCQEIGGFNG